MKTNGIIKTATYGALLFAPLMSSHAKVTKQKPNIIFILADDLGWSDLQCYGSNFYETPNLNQLASQGVRFTDAYAACHVSSPTRASILTGQYPARNGITDWLPGRKNFPFQQLINVESKQHLSYEENSSIASVLQSNGYQTAVIGKWHLGEDSLTAARQGFKQHTPSGWLKGWPAVGYFSPYKMEGLPDGANGEYLTDRLTSEATQFITENRDKPFFLYLSHYAPHDPIQGRPDLVKKYQEKLLKMPKSELEAFVLEGNPDDKNPLSANELHKLIKTAPYQGFKLLPNRTVKIKQIQDNVHFAAMIESVDESVGRIMKKLKELGLDQNTIIIFNSDNGGMSAGNFGNPGRIISKDRLDLSYATSNLPLRGSKGFLYEGGIRVPLIISWPKRGMSKTVIETPVSSVDYYPTILEMTGIKLKENKHIVDGVSIAPLIEKKKSKSKSVITSMEGRPIYWHFPHYSNHGLQSPGGAIRMGDYKLLDYFENNTVQLFNLKNDPGEKNDLSKKEPEKAKQLKALLEEWRKQVNAPMMLPNSAYDPNTNPSDFNTRNMPVKMEGTFL